MIHFIRHLIKISISKIWSLFLNGLLTLLPITITVALFSFSLQLLTSWLKPINHLSKNFPQWIPHAEIVIAFVFILVIGIVLRSFVLQSLIKAIEYLLFRIPLVRPVYSGIKQLVHAFSPQDTVSFKKIVFIEFPHKNVYSLGFLTSEVSQLLTHNPSEKMFCIFIPTTPNPTSGFCVIVPESSITVVDLTHQEAMALIISGGIVQPERFTDRCSLHETQEPEIFQRKN